MAGEQRILGFFESLKSHLPGYCRKSFQEALKAMPSLEVVEERAHQDSCATKDQLTGHHCGVANDYGLHVSSVAQIRPDCAICLSFLGS